MAASLIVGSPQHRRALSRFFVQSFEAFEPETIAWPQLEGEEYERLARLPFWSEAVRIETSTSRIVEKAVQLEPDPEVREAIALQAYEEGRHARLLAVLTDHYGIEVPQDLQPQLSGDAERDFLHAGYAECFDSFFAFGMFALARRSGFFVPELVEHFERVMQEEARHILFFVNWVAYRRKQLPPWRRPIFAWRCAKTIVRNVWTRAQTARRMSSQVQGQRNFTLSSAKDLSTDLTLRGLLELCLRENDRRLDRYDPQLLRPQLVPRLARLASRLLPSRPGRAQAVPARSAV